VSQPTHGKPKPVDPKPGTASGESEPTPASTPNDAALARAEVARSDTVLIHGVSDDGESFAVLRAREDRLEAGVVRKVKDGEPLHGELLRLTPRPESPLLCDVEVQYAPPRADTSATRASTSPEAELPPRAPQLKHGGPAQVATSSYRANWDVIWSKPVKPSQPN
jgi:hypothetical protein